MEDQKQRNVVVVGTDMAATGTCALDQALKIVAQFDESELHVAYAIPIPSELNRATKLEEVSNRLQSAREELRAHVAEVCAINGFDKTATLHVRLGDAAPIIRQLAADVEADLIVVGTRGQAGMQRWVMGSCAEELMRTARANVMIAHEKNYEGVPKTPTIEPPREGEDLTGSGYADRFYLSSPQRVSHVSGLL